MKKAPSARLSLWQKLRKHRLLFRLTVIALALCLLGGIFGIGVNWHMSASVSDRILTPEDAAAIDADCILVLGAGLRKDGSPSPILRERIDRGIELYTLGAAPKLLMSGDHGQEDYDEVNVMKQYALDEGIR